jgi:hypothetical protein
VPQDPAPEGGARAGAAVGVRAKNFRGVRLCRNGRRLFVGGSVFIVTGEGEEAVEVVGTGWAKRLLTNQEHAGNATCGRIDLPVAVGVNHA